MNVTDASLIEVIEKSENINNEFLYDIFFAQAIMNEVLQKHAQALQLQVSYVLRYLDEHYLYQALQQMLHQENKYLISLPQLCTIQQVAVFSRVMRYQNPHSRISRFPVLYE